MRVFQNLFKNSLEAGATQLTVSMARAGERFEMTVVDNGAGMDDETLQRIFDPFFTTKPIGQGTGLGLSMIYGFVQQSGGHVLLRSAEGHGTTVAIYLPRHLGAEVGVETIEGVAPIPQAEAGVAVLLVEDEPAVRMVMADVLRDNGYTVMEANTGYHALRQIQSSARIDLLLSDVGLPGGMNGRQLADAAREHRPHLKVLFVTGYDEQASLGSGLMAQACAALLPFFPPK
jgi:CheY-like chemotaxis protein